jgi:hypothetical protein
MSASELEEYLFQEPFLPLRLTLASGDQLVINNSQRAVIAGLSLIYAMSDDPNARIGKRVRIVSIPNIVLIEPADRRPRGGRRR